MPDVYAPQARNVLKNATVSWVKRRLARRLTDLQMMCILAAAFMAFAGLSGFRTDARGVYDLRYHHRARYTVDAPAVDTQAAAADLVEHLNSTEIPKSAQKWLKKNNVQFVQNELRALAGLTAVSTERVGAVAAASSRHRPPPLSPMPALSETETEPPCLPPPTPPQARRHNDSVQSSSSAVGVPAPSPTATPAVLPVTTTRTGRQSKPTRRFQDGSQPTPRPSADALPGSSGAAAAFGVTQAPAAGLESEPRGGKRDQDTAGMTAGAGEVGGGPQAGGAEEPAPKRQQRTSEEPAPPVPSADDSVDDQQWPDPLASAAASAAAAPTVVAIPGFPTPARAPPTTPTATRCAALPGHHSMT